MFILQSGRFAVFSRFLGWGVNTLSKMAIAIIVASIAAMIWGFHYQGEHPIVGAAAFFGYSDPTYTLAGWAAGLGVIGFLIGIALLIAGLIQSSTPAPATMPSFTAVASQHAFTPTQRYCPKCGSINSLEHRFCTECGSANTDIAGSM